MGIDVSRLKAMAPKPTRSNVTDNVITKEDSDMNNTTSTATINNTNAKENTTMNREIRTGKKTEGQFTVDYQKNGYGAIIPIIDGVEHPELMMGYVSEADAQAGIELLGKALKATNGNIPQAMRYMYTAAKTTALDIKVDEEVDVDGVKILINYKKRKAYRDGVEIANLDNIECYLPNEAIKPMLEDKVRIMMNHRSHCDEF